MGILDTIMRHTNKDIEDEMSKSSRLADIIAQHEAAAEVQASFDWQHRRPNVGMDPGTHPVLLQAAAEKAREEQAERTRRWGQNAMMPAAQLYSGVTNNKYPGVSRLDALVRQNNMDRERKQGTVPYRNYSPLTDTMSPWLPKLTEKKEVSSEGAKKMSDMTSTLSPWLEQKSSEYAENGGEILSRDKVERIAKLQGEISDLQKQLDNLPPSHLRGLRGQKVADGINQEIGLKRQTIEMIRNEAPTKGTDLTSASSAFENRLLKEETRKAEEKKSNPYLDQAHADLNYKVDPGQMPTNERLQRISEIQQELRILDPDRLESLTAPGAMRGASEKARKNVEERLKRAQSLEEELDALQKGYSYEPSTYSRLAEASEEAQKEQNRFLQISQSRNLAQEYDRNGTIDIPDVSKSAQVLANEGREKAALDYVRKYENQRADTKFGANYTAGRISQDESLAWNDYLRNPSEANRRYAETISAVGAKYQANNADIMQKDDSVAGLITEDFARYVPQMIDQFKYEALPMLFGAMVGGDKGMKVGRLIGSAAYSMETMSGAAFKNLLDAGVDEETARKACKNEAFLSTIIECADEIVDMFTTGFGKAGSALFGTPVKGFDSVLQNFVGSSTWKKWAVRLGKYGLNVLSEANEEGSQEAISIANEKRMAEGKEISLTGLAMDAIKIYIDAIFNRDSENRERIGEAAAGGARLALVNMPMESAGNAALYAGSTLRSGQQIRANRQIDATIENGLYNDPNSRAYQLAQRVQAGQEQTGGNRLQEIARQMQQDFQIGQLEQENRTNEAEILEADTLVRTLAEKAATGEHITKSEVAEILGNDLAVQELETASGQQISTIENRSERVETVRNALSIAAENYQAASSLENAERMDPLSTVTGTAGNGPFSGSEGQSLDLTSALRNIAMSDRGQQINAGLQTMTSPRLGEITARQAALRTETRSRIMEERAQGIREDARARSVEAMNDRIERAAQASVERWTETLEEYNKSENFDNERLEAFAQETFLKAETPGTSGYMAFVAEWMPEQDETRYAQEWLPYYNAGTKGTPITEVGDISTQILTQEQREHAYEAGRWDARDQIVKEVANELGQQENTVVAGTAGAGGRTERIDSPSAGVGSGRGSIWAEEAGRRRRIQAEYAASAGDIAASEGLKAVSPNSLGIKGVSDRQSITEIPEGSALYTEEMRRLKDRAAAFGNELHFYLGTMSASDGKTEVRGSNEGRRVWVQADHPVHDAATLARHEEFHTVKRYYPRVLEMVKKKIISTYSEAELQEFTGTYTKAYGMAGMSGRDIFEEICADAYAGLDDFFEVRETGYEGATRFTDAAREASQEFEARVQEDVREGLSEQEVREREGKSEPSSEPLDNYSESKFSRMIEPYSQHELDNYAKAKKIDFYKGNKTQIELFAEKALNDKLFDGKLYFGKVSSALAADIQSNTGYDFNGLNVALYANIVRKGKKDHGDRNKEALRGQKSLTAEDYCRIPDVLENYERIEGSVYHSAQGDKPAVTFYFTDGDERSVLTFVKSGKSKLDMHLQTMYINKKGGIANVPTAQAMSLTSGTLAGTTSKNNVTQQQENVNQKPTSSPDIRFSREANPDVRFSDKEINEITRKVENGEGLTSSEEVRFSLNHDADFVEKERAFKQSFVSGNVLTASFAQREFVRNKLMQPGIRELLPEDKMGKTSFGNGSYGRSMEHSTICPRTLSMEAILDGLSEKFGRPITVDESIKISQLAWAYMDAPECAYCYVAMDRKAKREYLLNYMTSRNEVFKNIDSGMSREDAYNAFLNGRKDTKPMKDRFNNWIRMHENGSEMIEMKDLASDRAIKAASEKSKSMANQVKDALKYAQSASWAKKYVQYTAYNGEILKWNQKLVNSLNRMYGMRMYSFSDFHPAFTLEDMQMITDASLRGLKVLAYTKELDFAWIMEPTGANINISVFAQNTKDTNGDYGMDAMQGADWDEAKALRAKSIKNGTGIGITMVCTNDDQVDWALGQEWIDVVIPFHMVKTGAKVAEHFGWTNYTDMQGDKKLKDLWDGKVNEAMIEPPEHQNNKQLYLEALERNNLSPRFEKWVDNPNYMKLVNETRRAEGETPTVQPKFNLDAADAMFDKMQKQGGYYQHLGLGTDVFEDLQDEIYDEYVEKYGQPTKYSRNRKISQDAQKTITGQQMDLEQKLMQTAELLKEANKEKEKLQKQLTEAQRNMQLSKEKRALESSVQRAAAKLLKSYDVYPDDRNKYDSIHYELSKTLEMMRNIVLNVKDPEVYEQELRRTAIKLTDQIIGGMKRIRSTDLESYQKIRDYLRAKPGITISEKDRADLKDYNAFRKRNMGRINLTNNGIPIDTAYQEMQSLYGEGYFPSDITHPADQLLRMEEIMQTLEPVYENFSSYEIAEMKEYMASDIENEILDIVMGDAIKSVPQTKADEIAAKYEQKIAGMEKSFNERLAAMQAENKEKINKIVDRERESRAKSEQKIRDYYREADAERRARRADSDARTRLLKIARRLNDKKLPTPNKALIQQYIGDMDLIAKSMTRQTLDKLSDLKQWYDTEKASNPDFISDPRIEQKLTRLSKWRISELSASEVLDLTEILRNIENEIRTQKYLIEAEDKRDIYVQGEETIRNIRNSSGRKAGTLGKLDTLFVNGTLSPVRAMRRMTGYVDSDPLYKATNALADGQRKMFDYQMRAGQMFAKWTEDQSLVREISGKHAKMIEIMPGVQITPDMRMALYLHLKNDQNLRHIAKGGVTIPDMKLYRKGDIAEAYNRGRTVKLSKTQVEEIVKGMSEKEKAFADQAAKYFGEYSQKAINETSELLKGYSLAEVKNYFPINTDRNFTRADFETLKMDGTIEGMGFLKERVDAANPIYLRDMSDVLRQSIDSTAKYVGLAIPVRNFNKIWNVATGTLNKDGKYESFFDDSVKQAVSKTWGEPGTKYIEKMMTDLQNGRKETNDWGKVLGKVRSHYAQAVLTLNASVALKQAASYPTAGAVLGWKPLMKALANMGPVNTEKINQYTPLLWYRTQGFSTQELGDMKARGMKLPKALNWVQGMDVLTTRKLWKASEYYIRDQRKELKVGSDEYYKAVAEVYNRVIEETQPNYTTMQRPQLLRTDDTLLSSMMMFKTQPFQNFNILYDAIGNLRAKEQQYKLNTNAETEAAVKAARRDAANAITSQVAQLAVFAGMTFAWAMFRGKGDKYKDEDGEQTFGSTLKGIGKDMIGNLFSSIPFGADAWEYISSKIFGDKYYGFDIATASSLDDLLNAFTKAGQAMTEVYGTLTDKEKKLSDINWNDQRLNMTSVLYAVGKIAGIPVENVGKLFDAIFRNGAHLTEGKYKGEYAYLRLTTSENKSSADYYNLLWNAYKNDPEAYEEIYGKMVELDGLNADKIKSAMEKRMKEEQGVKSVSDLDQRFMAPETQDSFDSMMDPIQKNAIWEKASEDLQDKLESKIYEISAGTNKGAEYQAKMDTYEAAGFDNTTWLLYQLALDIADEKGDGNGSYNSAEKEAAIRMLGLSQKKSYDLWEMQSNAKTDKNNPWKK